MNYCPVCYNIYNSTTFIPQITKCGHVLCSKCISYLKNVTDKCFICRQIVDYDDVIIIYMLIDNNKIDFINEQNVSNSKVNTWIKECRQNEIKLTKMIKNTNLQIREINCEYYSGESNNIKLYIYFDDDFENKRTLRFDIQGGYYKITTEMLVKKNILNTFLYFCDDEFLLENIQGYTTKIREDSKIQYFALNDIII